MIIHNMQIYNKFKKNMDIYTKKIRNIIQRNISSSLYFFYIQILNNFKLINLYIQNLNFNTRISFLFFSFQQFSIRVWISPFYTEDGRFPSSFVTQSHRRVSVHPFLTITYCSPLDYYSKSWRGLLVDTQRMK